MERIDNVVFDGDRLTVDELLAILSQIYRSLLHKTMTETQMRPQKKLKEQHKFNIVQTAPKIITYVFWDYKIVILNDYLTQVETIDAVRYGEI